MKCDILWCSLVLMILTGMWPHSYGGISGNWEDVVRDAQHETGFMDFYWKPSEGKVFLEVGFPSQDFLYVNFLSSGVGSNDIGFDRGQLGATRVVRFYRYGNKVLLIQPNLDFRAESDHTQEVRAVEDAFAQSVLGGFEIEAEKNNKVLIDITDLIISDMHGIPERMEETGQGSYALDRHRSAIFEENLKNFEGNTVFESLLTFEGSPKGSEIRSVAPSAATFSVRQRHNFVQLPDDGYVKRPYDVRSGFFNMAYMDFAAPLGQPVRKMFIERHRLEKKYPSKQMSEPVKPIVYYLDRGTPEPIRSALIDGASWWSEAFEAAGFKNAFRVELLPDGADPLDIRYNVIQWVHRATRGWSYGASVVDPRTGEIIKGHVSLGSMRVRQDYMIAEGLLAPYADDSASTDAMQNMALARLRQLSAHEVGHTLGLAHNFAASASPGNSVMDYPHPRIALDKEGNIDLSAAYDVGIGEWDKGAIAYGYTQFADGVQEEVALDSILSAAAKREYRYISDQDARSRGGAHPTAHLWDNGQDAVEELHRILKIRNVALKNFSESNIPFGMPMAALEGVLVPIYLMHRYQVEAAVKLIGGVDYSYTIRGKGRLMHSRVAGDRQRSATEALIRTLEPATLAIDRRILDLIVPQPPGYTRDRENMDMRTGPVFDPLAAAETAAQLVLELMLDPERCERIYAQHAIEANLPGLEEYFSTLTDALLDGNYDDPYAQAVGHRVAPVYVRHVIGLALNPSNSGNVRAVALYTMDKIQMRYLKPAKKVTDTAQKALSLYIIHMIDAARDRIRENMDAEPLRVPDGSPIGGGGMPADNIWMRQRCTGY